MKKKLIRVTSVLDYVESKWKEYWWRSVGFETADKISRDSAAFGTLVHKKIEGVLKNEITLELESQLPEDQCAIAVVMWLEQNGVKPLFETYEKSLEIEVKDSRLGLIGHFDYAALVNGEPCIVDFKTSNKMRKSFPLQKAAYAKMANKQLKVDINKGITIRSHWNKETQSVEFETQTYDKLVKKYWPKFKDALIVYKYFNGSKEK